MTRLASIIAKGGLAIALAGMPVACSPDSNVPEPGMQKVYSGLYLSAFEVSAFLPDGVPEHWWLVGSIPPLTDAAVGDVPGLPDARVARIVVEGTVTDKGLWGHLGSGERELRVARAVKQSPASWNDFQLASCKLPIPEWMIEQDKQAELSRCEELREWAK